MKEKLLLRKTCSIHVSDIHFATVIFPYISKEIENGATVNTILERDVKQNIEKVIKTVDRGIPLGFTTSQWFANFLLTELDHKIKQEMGVKHYIRFMDDMILFGPNKRELHRIRRKIADYLETELHLRLKDNWQVFPVDGIRKKNKKGRFLDFLGFKIYRDRVGLRSKIALKIQRKAKRIHKKGRANIKDARQMVTYAGFAKYENCRQWFRKHVLPYVSIRRLRRKTLSAASIAITRSSCSVYFIVFLLFYYYVHNY